MDADICFLVTITAVSVIMDLRSGKIDNAWLIFSLVIGFMIRFITEGVESIPNFILGLIIPFILLSTLFIFHMIGAGDIKLLCVLGSILGVKRICICICFTFFLGAILSIFILFLNGNICQRFLYFFYYIEEVIKTRKIIPYYRKGLYYPENFHFTIPIFMSVILYAGGIY